jgi:hypothetical protein
LAGEIAEVEGAAHAIIGATRLTSRPVQRIFSLQSEKPQGLVRLKKGDFPALRSKTAANRAVVKRDIIHNRIMMNRIRVECACGA